MCFQRNTVYNMHSLLISRIGFQSDSLQKTEISLGKLVLICRMMDGLMSMLLCFGLVRGKGYIQKQGSLKRCVLSTLTQPVWDIKGFYENQAVAWWFLWWIKSSHSDVLEYSTLLKTAQSLLSSSSTRRAVGWGGFLVLYLCCSNLDCLCLLDTEVYKNVRIHINNFWKGNLMNFSVIRFCRHWRK